MASAAGRVLPVVTDAERAVADLLPIEVDPAAARRALERVPLWFHTFALNREHGLYTPGVARDHRYRVPLLPLSFAGERVLDVGTFDGFYAFLAEHRRAAHVVAVDNEQYVAWVRARWGIELQGGEGFATIAELLGSRVQYRRGDALALEGSAERFDVVLCFGILHRVENPLGLLRRLAALLAPGGRLLVETYGIASDGRLDAHTIEVQQPGGVYAGDEYVYWGFGEDLMAGGVSPPAPADRLTGDLLCQIWQRAASGLQHDPLLAHPVQRIHEPRFKHGTSAYRDAVTHIRRKTGAATPLDEHEQGTRAKRASAGGCSFSTRLSHKAVRESGQHARGSARESG